MKSFILVVLVAASVGFVLGMTDQEKMEMMVKVVGECQAKHKGKPDDIRMLMEKKEPTSPEGKCMFHCIMEHIGILKDDKINKEQYMPWMLTQKGANEKISEDLMIECNKMMDPNPCENAVKMGFCIRMAASKIGIDVDF